MPHPTDDVWNWRVHYSDHTTLDEFTPDPDRPNGWQDHGFAEVDLARVVAIELAPSPTGEAAGLPAHLVIVDGESGQRPIFFRRRQPILHGAPGEEQPIGKLNATILGWQRTIRERQGRRTIERNVAAFHVYLDNGSSFITDRRDFVNERLYLIAVETATAILAEREREQVERETQAQVN